MSSRTGTALHVAQPVGPITAETAPVLQVLSVGSNPLCNLLRDALLGKGNCKLTIASDYRELWVIPTTRSIHVAVLHQTLLPFELEDAARFVRHRWPAARILIIRSGAEFLEDALYDDRLLPAMFPRHIVSAIEQLMSSGMRCESCNDRG